MDIFTGGPSGPVGVSVKGGGAASHKSCHCMLQWTLGPVSGGRPSRPLTPCAAAPCLERVGPGEVSPHPPVAEKEGEGRGRSCIEYLSIDSRDLRPIRLQGPWITLEFERTSHHLKYQTPCSKKGTLCCHHPLCSQCAYPS